MPSTGFTVALSSKDFESCSGRKNDAQYLYERSKTLLEAIKSEYPRFGEERFASYAAQPYRRNGRGKKGQWRDHSWVGFADTRTLPGRKQEWVQLQAAIHDKAFAAEIWMDWQTPEENWELVSKNVNRNRETFKDSLRHLEESYHVIAYGGNSDAIVRFKCSEATDEDINELQQALTDNAEALEISRKLKKSEAISQGEGILSFIARSFDELTPTYLAMVGRGAEARKMDEQAKSAKLGKSKKTVLFADVSWNPFRWTKPYSNPEAPHRYVQKHPGHESLNFDFEKGGVDSDNAIYGFSQFAYDPVDLAYDSTIFFYSKDYVETNQGYIVGVYGRAKLIGHKEIDWPGFENNKISFNLRADPKVSFRFPVYLPSKVYISTRTGQIGFKYGTVAEAEKILLDEYLQCLKSGKLDCLSKLTELYSSVTGKEFPEDTHPPIMVEKLGTGKEVGVEDETATTNKQKLIDDAVKALSNWEVLTTRPPVDTSGLNKPTSGYTGPFTGKAHVKVGLATKMGRALNLKAKPLAGCPGGVVLVEDGYEGKLPDSEVLNFAARMKKIMEAIKGGSDGPNPDNIRILITSASTDAKLLPKDGLIGFNAINYSETDAFWVMAAAREVAYLKRVMWYQHLRLMTELVVRAFGSLDLTNASSTDK